MNGSDYLTLESSSFFPEVRSSRTLIGLQLISERGLRGGRRWRRLRGENRRLLPAKIRVQNRDGGGEERPVKLAPLFITDLPIRV